MALQPPSPFQHLKDDIYIYIQMLRINMEHPLSSTIFARCPPGLSTRYDFILHHCVGHVCTIDASMRCQSSLYKNVKVRRLNIRNIKMLVFVFRISALQQPFYISSCISTWSTQYTKCIALMHLVRLMKISPSESIKNR